MIVTLGGNDLLQGADPATTKANLRRIIERLKARRIRVVLAGLRAPPLIGASYAREFTNLYPALARETGVAFLACGHHATERYGAPALAARVAQDLGVQHRFIEIDNPA